MHDVKTFYHNKLLIDRFFDILPKSAQLTKNDPQSDSSTISAPLPLNFYRTIVN